MPDSAEEAVQRPEGHAGRDCCTLALRLSLLLQQGQFQESQQNSGLWPSIGLAHQAAFETPTGPSRELVSGDGHALLPGQGAFCPSPSYHCGPAGDELD